tara:strand:+ start:70 stop:471 length:402 start_codon:yes stop_codon:yes gene_type:complete
MTSKIKYLGNLRTEATHLRSGISIITDAPVDNNGKGEAFSPTDLVATALGSCMLTIMGIVARKDNIYIEDTTVEVSKIMSKTPRRIDEIRISFVFRNFLDEEQRKKLERAARTCPVSASLHNDVKETIEFNYL